MRANGGRARTQSIYFHQVGSIENEVPGVVDSPVTPHVEEGMEFAPSPPIVRDAVSSEMKILKNLREICSGEWLHDAIRAVRSPLCRQNQSSFTHPIPHVFYGMAIVCT